MQRLPHRDRPLRSARRLSERGFEQRLDTTDAWIRSRTGIAERRFASEGGASRPWRCRPRAMSRDAGIEAAALDCIIVATMTPDRRFHRRRNLTSQARRINAWGFDLAGACSGFVYALVTATKLVRAAPPAAYSSAARIACRVS